jgi:diacylglycerol kinase (ATP)
MTSRSDPVPAANPDISTPRSVVCAVVRNPGAGRGRHRRALDTALEVLAGSGFQLRLIEAGTADEALAGCHQAVADGADVLVAAGGDGTVHLAVQAAANRPVALGILPVGTGNDFAAAMGIPADPLAAAHTIAAVLRGDSAPGEAARGPGGGVRVIDVARVDGPDGFCRRYVAVLAAGFDALVNERANTMRFPRGRLRYDVAIYAELLTLRHRRYQVRLDGDLIDADLELVAVGNTATYGGGLRMCPAADPTDGELDVIMAGGVSRTRLVRLRPRLADGTHITDPRVQMRRARTITIAAEGIVAYADGERLCPLPISIGVEGAALRVIA